MSPRKRGASKATCKDFFELDFNDIQLIENCPHLSDGVFYDVYDGLWNDQEVYIFYMDGMSKFRRRFISNNEVESNDSLYPELYILKQLPLHRNIIQVIGICHPEPEVVVLVVEKFGQMTLEEFIHNTEKLDAKKLISIGRKIARTIEFLHKHGVFHCDIGLCNILIDTKTLDIKFFKFTLSRKSSDPTSPPQLGPVRSMAPEQVRDNKISSYTDVWQIGVTFFEMVSKTFPYEDLSQEDVYELLKSNEYKLQPPRSCPPLLSQLIHSCTTIDPSKRPSIKTIVNILNIPKNKRN